MKQTSILAIVSIVILIVCIIMYFRSLSREMPKENFESRTGNMRAFYRRNRRKFGNYFSDTFSNSKNAFNRKMRKLSM